MLCSALSRESESVFVDLLTYGDLEILKARKTGSTSVSSSGGPPRSQSKRYMILTYSGEFDRVHFPIPLTFEEKPDVPSLQRTIARLKRSLLEKTTADLDQSTRDDSGAMSASQLRQENTELRHRLRKFEGRALPSGMGPAAAVSVAASQQNGELLLAYSKLKRQYDSAKKELNAATMAYERLRTESAKEITRLKLQVVGDTTGARAQSEDANDTVKRLRAKCVQLKKDLDTERTEHKRCIARHQRELANLRHHSSTYPRRSSSPSNTTGTNSSRRPSPSSSGLPPRPSSAGTNRTSTNSSTKRPSVSQTIPSRSSRTSIPRETNTVRRPTSPLYGRSSQAPSVASPDNRRGGAYDRYSRSVSRSPSPVTERPPWNAGAGRKKPAENESGYSSAGSAGSRQSRGSTRSGGQNSVASSRSGRGSSATGSKKPSKKRVPKSAYSDDSDAPYFSNEDVVARKKKISKKGKDKKRQDGQKKKPMDPLDIDILDSDLRGSRSSLGLNDPRRASSPPREDSRRSQERSSGQERRSREDLRQCAENGETITAVRRSDESRRSHRKDEAERTMLSSHGRESRSDSEIFTSSTLQDGVLGSSLVQTQRLDPNAFPVSRTVEPIRRQVANDGGDDDDEEMRRAFDGLSMAKRSQGNRSSSELPLRRSQDSQASDPSRRSRDGHFLHSEKGPASVSSKPIVISRAGPARGEIRDRNPGSSSVEARPSESEDDADGSVEENDISEIDKRIKALQSFLDKARYSSIMARKQSLMLNSLTLNPISYIHILGLELSGTA